MAGVPVVHLARSALALHHDQLGHAGHRLPAALVLVFLAVAAICLIHVEVFLVHVETRQHKGDAAVVADGDAGQKRFARADHIHAGGRQVRDIAQAGRAVRTVRVIGKNRPARGGHGRGDRPVVAAVAGKRVGIGRVQRGFRQREQLLRR
ncbi:hypothetical protein SDC9_132609 [bioreactor metagenome]|uniref:Uncharacterized protein n=1 Tax=bioreactor metagenome TaxID=1076179 RepID=A0A645D903_9ZZZZ